MDKNAKRARASGGIEIKSRVIFGPVPIPGADAELEPLIAGMIAVISAAATNLIHYAAAETAARGAARRLCALAALCACGELRALLVLCGSGLTLQARIHLRALSDCLKRIVVYDKDQDFALDTERSLPDFKASGFSKLDDTARARLAERDDEMMRRFDQLMDDAKPPLLMTKNPLYEDSIVATLNPFQYWVNSQVEHCTPIALAEISSRLSTDSESIYLTGEGMLLLVAAVGMGLAITAHLIGLGVSANADLTEMMGRFTAILKRSDLAGSEAEADAD